MANLGLFNNSLEPSLLAIIGATISLLVLYALLQIIKSKLNLNGDFEHQRGKLCYICEQTDIVNNKATNNYSNSSHNNNNDSYSTTAQPLTNLRNKFNQLTSSETCHRCGTRLNSCKNNINNHKHINQEQKFLSTYGKLSVDEEERREGLTRESPPVVCTGFAFEPNTLADDSSSTVRKGTSEQNYEKPGVKFDSPPLESCSSNDKKPKIQIRCVRYFERILKSRRVSSSASVNSNETR